MNTSATKPKSSNKIILSAVEKEISILLSTRQLIKSMVNRDTLSIDVNEENGITIRANNMSDSKFFSILLVDFISPINSTFGSFRSHVEALKHICKSRHFNFNNSIAELETAVDAFDAWLLHEVVFEKICLPSTSDKELKLQMKRDEFIRICGDISKHNKLRLSRTANRILNILQRTNPKLNISDAFSGIGEFYEWFHTDVFHYHLTKISEMLNNIVWGIQTYLTDEYNRSYTVDSEKSRELKIEYYSFKYPNEVTHPLGKYYYWELMNEIRAKPYIKKFKTCKYLEVKY